MNEKILLINIHSSRNAGDEALTQVTLCQLHEQFSPRSLVMLIDDPDSYQGPEQAEGSLFHWASRFDELGQPRWQAGKLLWMLPATLLPILICRLTGRAFYGLTPPTLRRLVQSYIEADLVVSKPGGFLYSSGSGVTLFVALFSMALALLAGKPLYVFPQSLGPLQRAWEKWAVRNVLRRARVLMVREPVSLREMEAWGLHHPNCRLVPDVAFAFPEESPEAAQDWLLQHGIDRRQGQPLLGMTAINWGAEKQGFDYQSQYEAALAAAARSFIEQQDGRVLLLPQVTGPSASQDDRVPARRIAAQLADLGETVFQVDEAIAPPLLKAIYGQMDVFAGTRMHSNIFALSEGVPVLAIAYQHKTTGILEMLGLGRWAIDIQEVEPDRLVELLQTLWQERDSLRAHLKERMPEINRQAGEAARLAAEDYQALLRKKRR